MRRPSTAAVLAVLLASGASAADAPSFDAAVRVSFAEIRAGADASAPRAASAASFESGFLSFPEAGPLLPPDKLFVPAGLKGPAPLVVVLHGCEQDADSIAAITRWNALAEKNGFLVLYPNQQLGFNPYNCWNWFLPANETAGIGETAEIVAAVMAARALYPVDPEKIYAVGISAGGAAAANLLACYPDVFAGGGVHSGVAYGLATDADSALAVMKDGPGDRARTWSACDPAAFRGRVLIVQGAADAAVNPANAERVATEFAGSGAVRTEAATPPGDGGAYGFKTVDFDGGRAEVREILVDGLAHAWSGGAPGLENSDPRGPDATALMWSFFSAPKPR